jgi:hypothetical protein
MKISLVGGTWGDEGGKPSSLVDKMYDLLSMVTTVQTYNGGKFSVLETFLTDMKSQLGKSDAVIWMANV